MSDFEVVSVGTAKRLKELEARLLAVLDAGETIHPHSGLHNLLREALTQQAAKSLLAKGEMLAAVVQGAREDFVKVPYGASHEDVAAINDWHKMAAEALSEWERS